MKIVVIGGTGLIGSKVVTKLDEHGHEAIAASPDTGVNTLTGEGLAEVAQGRERRVDVSNSPSFEDAAVMEFFTTATAQPARGRGGRGRRPPRRAVGRRHRAPRRERLLPREDRPGEADRRRRSIPYSIVHATQFFEFIKSIAAAATDGDEVRAPAGAVPADGRRGRRRAPSAGPPRVRPCNGIVEVAGPDEYRLDELIRDALAAQRSAHRRHRPGRAVLRHHADRRRPGPRVPDAHARRDALPGLARAAARGGLGAMTLVRVIIVSPEEAADGNAEFWCGPSRWP